MSKALYKDIGESIRSIEDALYKISVSRVRANDLLDIIQSSIKDLAEFFKHLDDSFQSNILRERSQHVVRRVFDQAPYFVSKSNLLRDCQAINPNPALLSSQIASGLSYLINNPEDPGHINAGLRFVKAGGIVESEVGLGNLMRGLSGNSEGAIRYHAKGLKTLNQASLATEYVSRLFQNHVDHEYLMDSRHLGVLLHDLLALLPVIGGREGSFKALSLIEDYAEFIFERVSLHCDEWSPHASRRENIALTLTLSVFKANFNSNLIAALKEADRDKYEKFIASPVMGHYLYVLVMRGDTGFDLSCIETNNQVVQKVLLDCVASRLSSQEIMDKKQASSYIATLSKNGINTSVLIDRFNGGDGLFWLLRECIRNVPEDRAWSAEDIFEIFENNPLGANCISLSTHLKQKDITSDLKTDEGARSFVSSVMLFKHGIDICEDLHVRRTHMSLLEIFAFVQASKNDEDMKALFEREFASTFADPRTQDAISKTDPETLEDLKRSFGSFFTEEFMSKVQWKSPHVLKDRFIDDLGL